MTFSLLINVAINVSLLLSLLFFQNLLLYRNGHSVKFSRTLQGIIIGMISIILMENSIYTHPGMIFDLRTVLLCVSGLYMGWVPTSIALLIASAYRIALGGTGVYVGVLSILVSALLGLLAGWTSKKNRMEPGWLFNFSAGFVTHAAILLLFLLFLPRPDNQVIAGNLALTYLLFLPLATGLIGRLFSYQKKFRNSQKELLEKKDIYQTLFQNNHTIMILVDPETGLINDANASAVKFYGWPYNTLTSMNINQINTSSQKEILIKFEVLLKNREINFTAQHRRADGSVRDVEVFSNSIQLEGKVQLYSIIHDITDRISTEKNLIKSQYQLSRAELIARLGHWELDLNNGLFRASRGACEIYGIHEDSINKIAIQAIPLKEYRPILDKAMADLVNSGTPYDISFEIQRPSDQEIRSIHSAAQYDRDSNLVFGVIHDITELKKSEEKIRQEREFLKVTLHSIGDGVITTDKDGRVQLMNQVAEQMTGWSNSDAHMKLLPEVFQIVDEYSHQACPNPVDMVLKTKGIIELANHTMLITKDGRELIIADSGAPIVNNQGEIIGTVLVFRDTTEKQIIQDRIIRAEKLESLGVLAGGIAHDFNNLLAGIFGYLELAQLENTNEKVREYLDQSAKVYNRTVDLTKQLLTFSKGNILERRTDCISGLIKETANFALSGSAVSSSISIEEDLYLCSFDINQIGQVLDNLLINAKQAMPGGGTIEITAGNVFLDSPNIMNLPKGNYVSVSIRDTGEGIPADIIPRIFDPFFSTKQMGSGLGLATCYSILEKHDGSINVRSNSEGSDFTFYLPAIQGQIEKTEDTDSINPSTGGKILIMDDESSIRVILREYLKSIGFEVKETADGKELLKVLEEDTAQGIHYSAAILDLTIPGGMGGVDTIVEIQKKGFTFPVFATSGYSEDSVISDPEKYGFSDSLSKPYKMKDLANLLSRFL